MSVQFVATIVLIAVAVLYLASRTWRTWAGGAKGCSGGCDCPSHETNNRSNGTTTFIAADQLRVRITRDR